MKTNAARILDQRGIRYELREYPADDGEIDAVSVAEKIGMPAGSVFKTLVARGDRSGVLVACIPAAAALNLKALAKASGNKRVEMVAVREIQSLTGYVRGGVSPLGMKKSYPTYVDASMLGLDRVSISAGRIGLQILLNGDDLVRALGCRTFENNGRTS